MVIGWMPADQLAALLRHELEHIRRWDQWANAVQVLAETLRF